MTSLNVTSTRKTNSFVYDNNNVNKMKLNDAISQAHQSNIFNYMYARILNEITHVLISYLSLKLCIYRGITQVPERGNYNE